MLRSNELIAQGAGGMREATTQEILDAFYIDYQHYIREARGSHNPMPAPIARTYNANDGHFRYANGLTVSANYNFAAVDVPWTRHTSVFYGAARSGATDPADHQINGAAVSSDKVIDSNGGIQFTVSRAVVKLSGDKITQSQATQYFCGCDGTGNAWHFALPGVWKLTGNQIAANGSNLEITLQPGELLLCVGHTAVDWANAAYLIANEITEPGEGELVLQNALNWYGDTKSAIFINRSNAPVTASWVASSAPANALWGCSFERVANPNKLTGETFWT